MCFVRSSFPQVDDPEQLTHLIIFESITGTLTRTTALHTSGWTGSPVWVHKGGGKCAHHSTVALRSCVRLSQRLPTSYAPPWLIPKHMIGSEGGLSGGSPQHIW